MVQFGSEQDAQNGLALAQRYSEHCFIGRHPSTRLNLTTEDAPARRRLIVHYWKRPTGQQTRISAETCHPYVGSALRSEDRGTEGWVVTDGKTFRIAVDNRTDAQEVIALARQSTTHCTIGSADVPWLLGPHRESRRLMRVLSREVIQLRLLSCRHDSWRTPPHKRCGWAVISSSPPSPF